MERATQEAGFGCGERQRGDELSQRGRWQGVIDSAAHYGDMAKPLRQRLHRADLIFRQQFRLGFINPGQAENPGTLPRFSVAKSRMS